MANLTYETLRLIFLIGAIAAGVMLAVTVALFFVLKIPKVIGDLTGRTARKAIEDIRKQNEQTGEKSYQSSLVNRQRGKLTDKITPSGRLQNRDSSFSGIGVVTEKISTSRLTMDDPNETAVLDNGNETTLLDSGYGETSLLDSGNETVVLDVSMQMQEIQKTKFEIEFEITYIHTDEIIP